MKQPRTRWAVCRSHTLDSTASSLSSFHSVSSPPSFNAHAPLPFSTQTMPVTSRSLFLFPLLLILIVTTICDATHHKRAVPFTSNSLHKRNLGGEFKDWYLQKFTKNYMCLDSRRVVPVDPETGHMLLKDFVSVTFSTTCWDIPRSLRKVVAAIVSVFSSLLGLCPSCYCDNAC